MQISYGIKSGILCSTNRKEGTENEIPDFSQPRNLCAGPAQRARHDGITLTELTRRALLSDDSDGCSDAVGIGRMPKNSDGRKQLGDEWKIKLPYAVGHKARAKAKQDGISLSSLARRAITGYLRTRNQDEHPLF